MAGTRRRTSRKAPAPAQDAPAAPATDEGCPVHREEWQRESARTSKFNLPAGCTCRKPR